MHGCDRFINTLNRAVPPGPGRGVVFLPFDVAFGAEQKPHDRAEAAGPIRVGVDGRVVFEILAIPAGGHVNFMDSLSDMARRVVQIVPYVSELRPVHQPFRTAQVGAGMQIGRVPSRNIAESGGPGH